MPRDALATVPAGAILSGDRDELVKEGKDRVNSLKKTYPNATFYGENELSGLENYPVE
jgi:hypothetical protein